MLRCLSNTTTPMKKRRRRRAATQARWRGRVRRREIVVLVTTRPCDWEKLVAAGYLAPAHRDDRESFGIGIAHLLGLMSLDPR